MLLLRYVDGGVGKVLYNSQEDDGEGLKWGYEMLERLGRWKYQGGALRIVKSGRRPSSSLAERRIWRSSLYFSYVSLRYALKKETFELRC